LAFWEVRSLIFQALLVTAAVVLPAFAHLAGAPVRIILPMHWPVILAGLVYGWRGGAVAGLLSPTVSYYVSGLPLPGILPAMTAELFIYGLVTGLLRERFRFNPFVSVTLALIIGRIAFVLTVLSSLGISVGSWRSGNYMQYFSAALLPGLAAAAGQIILLPLVANWWMKREQGISKH